MTNGADRKTGVPADPKLRGLSIEEDTAEVAAAIQEKLMDTNYGSILAERGVTTVAFNDKGEIIEHRPDGSSTVVTAKRRRGSTDASK